MTRKTLIAFAVGAILGAPLAAQASLDSDSWLLAQTGGPGGASATGTAPTGGAPSPMTAGEPKAPTAERGAAAGATGAHGDMPANFSALDSNNDGQISRAEWDTHFRPAGSASGGGTTGTTAGPGSVSPRTGAGSATATTPDTSGHGKPK